VRKYKRHDICHKNRLYSIYCCSIEKQLGVRAARCAEKFSARKVYQRFFTIFEELGYFRTKLIMGKRNDNGQLVADKLVIKLSLNACAMEDI